MQFVGVGKDALIISGFKSAVKSYLPYSAHLPVPRILPPVAQASQMILSDKIAKPLSPFA